MFWVNCGWGVGQFLWAQLLFVSPQLQQSGAYYLVTFIDTFPDLHQYFLGKRCLRVDGGEVLFRWIVALTNRDGSVEEFRKGVEIPATYSQTHLAQAFPFDLISAMRDNGLAEKMSFFLEF